MVATLPVGRAEKLAEIKRLRAEVERREQERLSKADVFGLLGYVPTPKQSDFHAATEHSVLFGGSTGGGKSRALTAEAIRACVRYPGLRVGAFRRSYPELRESLLAELAKLQFAAPLGARWNGSEHELRFSNGSLIMFRYAETLADATRRQGGEYQLVCFDELTLFHPDVVTFLESRVRSGRADLPVIGIRASANPGGPGHSSVKERYIKPTSYGADVVLDERGRTVRFVPSKLSDNPHMNPEHATDLLALSGQLREAFLEGNWDVFAGQMYPELKRDRHVVEPITLPAAWVRYCGIDWGYFPGFWAVVWSAVDEDGRVWVYREAYEQKVGEADQAKRILAAEAPDEHVAARFSDDAMFAARGAAKPISDVYADNGVYLTPASKGSRVTGWQRVRSYLSELPACPHHRALGWKTCPKLHILAGCENLFRHLADLSYATKGDPEDAGANPHDHLPDALRYLLINLGTESKFVFPDAATATDGRIDPAATPPPGTEPPPDAVQPAPGVPVRTIGGFPVLGAGSDPWGLVPH